MFFPKTPMKCLSTCTLANVLKLEALFPDSLLTCKLGWVLLYLCLPSDEEGKLYKVGGHQEKIPELPLLWQQNYHNIGDGDIIRTDWRINLGGSRWRKKQTPKFTNCRAPWKLLGWKSLRWLLLVFWSFANVRKNIKVDSNVDWL